MRANGKLLGRLSLDCVMVGLMLLTFAYQLTGGMLHELIGVAMFAMAAVHGLLNRRWFGTLFKGKYGVRRLTGNVVNLLLLVAVVLLFASGFANSQVFGFLRTDEEVFSRRFHAWAAYWMLVLVSIHLGLHWKMVLAEVLKAIRFIGAGGIAAIALRILAVMIAACGVRASFDRDMYSKLMAHLSFDYWDFSESVAGFFAEYLSIMGVFVCVTYYASKLFRK